MMDLKAGFIKYEYPVNKQTIYVLTNEVTKPASNCLNYFLVWIDTGKMMYEWWMKYLMAVGGHGGVIVLFQTITLLESQISQLQKIVGSLTLTAI